MNCQFSPMGWNSLVSHLAPLAFRSAASVRCRCSRPDLATVVASMSFTFRLYVTSFHKRLDSNLPCSATFLQTFGWMSIFVTSTNTSFFPVAHLAIILPLTLLTSELKNCLHLNSMLAW